MSLYETWMKTAYDKQGTSIKKFWAAYMPLEQKIYEDIITAKDGHFTGGLMSVAAKYNMKPEQVCGFLDGIKEAAAEEIDMETVTEDFEIDINVDFERLYKKMVEYKAEHLYTLPAWDGIYTKEEQERLYDEQKRSGTYIRGEKAGRNDPCPCGSGKKYKKCCGAVSA